MDQYLVELVGANNLYPAELKEKMAKSEKFSEAFFGYENGHPIPDGLGSVLFCKLSGVGIVFQGDSGLLLIKTPSFLFDFNRFLHESKLAKGFVLKEMSLSLRKSPFPILYHAKSMVIARTLEKQMFFKSMSTDEKVAFLEKMIARDIEQYANRYGLNVYDELNVRVDPESAEQSLSYFKHKKTAKGGHTTLTIMRDLLFSVDVKLSGYWAVGRVRTNGNGRVAYDY